jgi:nucleoside-diphosphate-sugar epimerase
MNVVVVGGGEKGKFGNDLVNRLRNEGHDVYILSHKLNGTNDPKQVSVDFTNLALVLDTFEKLTSHLDTIDLFLYNTSDKSHWLNQEESFTSTANFDMVAWQNSLNTVSTVPYNLIVKALSKMNENSKIFYMATGLATAFDRTEYTKYAGYAGGKALMIHIMLGFAHHNDKGAIVSVLCPHFDYNNKERYDSVFEGICRYIANITKEQNGKIVKFLR